MDDPADYLIQLAGAVSAMHVESPVTYSWFGARSAPLPGKLLRALPPHAFRAHLLQQMQEHLYRDFYCQGAATPQRAVYSSQPLQGVTPFVERLTNANSGSGCKDTGWQVTGTDGDLPVLGKRDLTLWPARDEMGRVEGEILAGSAVGLRLPPDLIGMSPGYYMALSDLPMPDLDPGARTIRVYWNISPEGAVDLVRLVTSLLNEHAIPFRLKVISDPDRYLRCDSAVLYFPHRRYGEVIELAKRIYETVRGRVRPGVPALTKKLAHGLGLAEDPPGGESFGLNRCMHIAEGLAGAYDAGLRGPARLEAVVAHLSRAGINIQAPYLRPGSIDEYDPLPESRSTIPVEAHGAGIASLPERDTWLEAAHRIGRDLCAGAIWYKGVCNWVGATMPGSTGAGMAVSPFRALGPDLYWGTAGVALALAELGYLTGDAACTETALGAIGHALGQAGQIPDRQRLSLFSGWVGLAFSAARVSALTGREEPGAAALELLARVVSEVEPCEPDYLSGYAGAIVGLLALCTGTEDRPLLEKAAMLGDRLLDSADRSGPGYSWRTGEALMAGGERKRQARPNLTGLSHGAAGMGAALLELYAATGASRFLAGAKKAFEYEEHWFHPEEGNWPDLRNRASGPRSGGDRVIFSTHWCHGAPGIALTRLRAYELTGDEGYALQAAAALHTTRAWVDGALASGGENFSLCHGLAGNAEVLLAGDRLRVEPPTGAQYGAAVARYGIEQYGAGERPWPCGTPGGTTPGLMLGQAGICLFYLRLYEPATPSSLYLQAATRSPGRPTVI